MRMKRMCGCSPNEDQPRGWSRGKLSLGVVVTRVFTQLPSSRREEYGKREVKIWNGIINVRKRNRENFVLR